MRLAPGDEPVWLDAGLAIKLHDRQIERHGSISGLRDAALLESAITRPRNRWAYGETNLFALAAAYAFGLARNHPFSDGNKRTAWMLARLFLAANGVSMRIEDDDEAIRFMQSVAAGTSDELMMTEWFSSRSSEER